MTLVLVVALVACLLLARLLEDRARPEQVALSTRRTAPRSGPRVLVVSGSYGAGHDRAAAGVAAALRTTGLEVDVVDVVDHYPWKVGLLLKRVYVAQLTTCPTTWSWTLQALSGSRVWSRGLLRLLRWTLGRLPARSLLALVTPETELVVSTHPFACAALALLRRRGDLTVPAVTYLTDPSVHPLWVHPGVDVHVAIYAEAQRQALGLDAAGVVLVQPPVGSPAPMTAHRRAALLATAGVPTTERVAFVVGGSEGLGDLVATAREVRRSGQLTPVVVCGHNVELQGALRTEPGVVALPWVDHLAELLVAGDVVVENAGGFTALESLAAGVPVVTYRPLPGHGQSNGSALAVDGLAAYAEDEEALSGALADALRRPRRPPEVWSLRPSLADALLPLLPLDGRRQEPAHAASTDLLAAS